MRPLRHGLDPVFVFLLTLIGGTLCFLVALEPARVTTQAAATPAVTLPAVPPPSVAEAPAARTVPVSGADPAALQRELETAEAALSEAEAKARALAAQLEEAAARARTLQEDLKRQSATAPQASRDATPDALATEREKLERTLAQRDAELTRIEAQLKALGKMNVDESRPTVTAAMIANKIPILVDLIHNRAFPVAKGFYDTSRFAWIGGPYTAARTGDGLSIEQVREPNGAFAEFLSKLNPGREYVSCLLNRDSFQAYEAVREVVRKRSLDIGWEPADTSNGRIKIYPVKLMSRERAERSRRAGRPDLPEIVKDEKKTK